ncbi:hypothetical protein V495_00267 [Pseudogymnoascus sp. VKM F-4514 (FW-929)]|nr:hypothetical protein V495_00267 [Pseudogymnoascus sp. VKM F-4514 (FW-929)]KFY67131.1 hypothetical protein V497_00560 [Pseudogymnoascus sp. VKM F-4516 (FW-969)]
MERTARMSMREEPPMFPHISGGEPSALGAAASADTDVALEVDEAPMGGSESSAEVGQRSEVTVVMTFDEDSSYGTDDADSGLFYETVGSSAFTFPKENGRTYHAYQEGKYLMPNDEKEQDRMDMIYHSLRLMFEDRLFFAPVKNPQRIADMATGTGIWAIDVGDQYEAAEVIGIDLSPIQPNWVPPNVQFRVDDIDKDWMFEHPLDLIHSRICSGLAIRDWPRYLRECMKFLKPGGWVEAQEFSSSIGCEDDSLPPDSMIRRWHEEANRTFTAAGCDLRFEGETLKRQMVDAGFVNCVVLEYRWPMGPWHEDKRLKDAGAFAMMSMLADMEAISLASMTRFGGWKMDELKVFLKSVKKEWRMKSIKAYWPLYVVYGQKPEEKHREE